MKLLYTTLSLATIGILVGCGPKSETTGIKKTDSIGVVDTTAKADVTPTPEKVILTAKGTAPLWTLIIGEKQIKFKLEDKDTVTASDYRMGDSTPTKQVYIGGKDFGITVEDKPATDVATGNKYAKTVSISFQGKQYKGYSGDVIGEDKPTATQTKPANPKAARYTVEGKWVLSTLNGRKVTKAKDFANGLATLEINTVDKRASGFGGCNRINGEVVTNGSNIKFDKIISTKMYCEGVKENDFMNALRNATSYNFADGILRLNGNGTTLATFIRPAE